VGFQVGRINYGCLLLGSICGQAFPRTGRGTRPALIWKHWHHQAEQHQDSWFGERCQANLAYVCILAYLEDSQMVGTESSSSRRSTRSKGMASRLSNGDVGIVTILHVADASDGLVSGGPSEVMDGTGDDYPNRRSGPR
jgi:hypothetical protein